MTPPPKRIQRLRTKGWRLPAGAIYVGRGSRLGNPYKTGEPASDIEGGPIVRDAAEAVAMFRSRCKSLGVNTAFLRGHDLACWCGLCDAHAAGLPLGVKCDTCAPCHADVLLELANK